MSEEITALEFGTPMGPVWPAAMYLAACAWPDSWPQRTRLVRALLHAGSRATGWRRPGPDRRVLERQVNRATERLEKSFLAAEVAQRSLLHDGQVSIKLLQKGAAHGWQAPKGHRDPDNVANDFRVNIWRRFLPAMHYIIPLKLHIQAQPIDIISLCLNTEWLDDALTSSKFWATTLLPMQQRIDADIIRLVRA